MKQIAQLIEAPVYRKSLTILCAVLTVFFAYGFALQPTMNAFGCAVVSAAWAVINATAGFRFIAPRWLIVWMWVVAFFGSVLLVMIRFN